MRLGVAATLAVLGIGFLGLRPSSVDAPLVKAGLLQLSDFAPGWVTDPNVPTSPTNLGSGIPQCKPFQRVKRIARAHGSSLTFTSGQTEVSNQIATYSSDARAEGAMSVLDAVHFPICIEKAVDRYASKLTGSTKLGDVTAGELSVVPAGSEWRAFEVAVPVHEGSLSETVYIDEEYVRVDRVIISYSFQDSSADPANRFIDLISTTVDRELAALQQTSAPIA